MGGQICLDSYVRICVQVTGTYEPVWTTEHAVSCPQDNGLEGGCASASHFRDKLVRPLGGRLIARHVGRPNRQAKYCLGV
jgi:hypothetical protein